MRLMHVIYAPHMERCSEKAVARGATLRYATLRFHCCSAKVVFRWRQWASEQSLIHSHRCRSQMVMRSPAADDARAVIVGAGFGALSAAVALHKVRDILDHLEVHGGKHEQQPKVLPLKRWSRHLQVGIPSVVLEKSRHARSEGFSIGAAAVMLLLVSSTFLAVYKRLSQSKAEVVLCRNSTSLQKQAPSQMDGGRSTSSVWATPSALSTSIQWGGLLDGVCNMLFWQCQYVQFQTASVLAE